MKIPSKFLSTLLVLTLSVSTTQSISDDTNSTETRKGRVNGRIVKLYSGTKPDPILCSEEGFQADPVNCAVFYRCAKTSKGKFTVFRFQCGPGTVYDPEIEICNHPSHTKRSECGGLLQNVLPDDDDNNNIERHEIPSPINTESSIYTNQLDMRNFTSTIRPGERYSDSKKNSTLSSSPLTSTSERYIDHSYNPPLSPWVDSQNKTQNFAMLLTTMVPIDKTSIPCTSDGFVGDSEDCRKFYRCVSNSRGGFVRYEFSCSESTIWDDNMQSCNHVWAVRSSRCGRKDNFNKNNSSIIDKTFNEIPIHNISDTNITVNRTNNYYEVYDSLNNGYENKLNDKLPSINTHVETATETENNINEYDETLNSAQKFESNKLSHDNTYGSSYPSNSLQQNHMVQATTNDKRRSDECSQSGFMSDSDDCQKFYRCVDNGRGGFTKYEFSCSQPTVWDSRIEACNHAWAVKDCGGKNLPPNSFTTSSSSSSSPSIISSIVEPSTSSVSIEENNNGYYNQMNQEHQQTTSSTLLTTITLLSTTEASQATGLECSSSGFFGDPNDCQKFFRCVQSDEGKYSKFNYECGDGTLWDQDIELCNHAWAVKSCDHRKSNSTIEMLESKEPNNLMTQPFIDTTTTENNNDYDNDSGYNHHIDFATTPSSNDISKTTSVNTLSQKNECQSSGFMGDTHDCKKFYRCVDNGDGKFTRHEFTCGDGTVWDTEIEACNHAWAVKECGNNMQSTANTNYISSRPTEITDYENEIAYTESNAKPDNFVTSTTIRSSSIITPTTKQECQSDGFMGDKNDCKKFYRCVDNGNGEFTQYTFSCGEGTAWDPKIEACNHEQAVENCSTYSSTQPESSDQSQINTQSPTPSTSHVTEIKETQTSEYSTISTSTVEVNNLNSQNNKCSSEGLFANSNDCKKFYRCVNDDKGGFTKYDFTCGDGTVWVQETQSCDHDTDVNCRAHVVSTTAKYEGSSTENLITQSMDNETVIHKPSDKECVSEGFYPSLNDCRDFYRCVDDGKGHYIKYEFSCAEGTAWDATIESCNHVNEVDSCKNVQTIPVAQNEQTSQSNFNKTTTEPPSESTAASSTTSKVSTENNSTPMSSTTLKSTTTKATTPKSTTTSSYPESKDVCEQDGYYGNTQECNKFYRCVSNEEGSFTKYDYTCGEGTIWDKDITACNHPQDVVNLSCKAQQETTSTTSSAQHTSDGSQNMTTTTTKPITTSSSSNINVTNSTCSNNDNVTESSNNNDNNNTIVCKEAGFYANPNDCKKFYRCVDWENNGEKFSIFHFECGDGTIWDPALETCNHADSVNPPRDCNNTQQQTANTTETSTTEQTTKPTTTQKTTTQTSTTQSSTTKSTTTEQSTIQTSMTQSSTTQSPTAQQSTTEPSTPQQSTTEQSTTQELTTETSTTQQSTTQQTTTQPQTTLEPTTEKSTTEQTSESTQTTAQSTQEQTTKMTTEQTKPTDVTESSTSSSTTAESSDQTTTGTATTQQSTTVETTSQTESSTTESSTTENQTESSTESNTEHQKCPDTDKDQHLFVCPTSFKRHPKYCNLFYQCTEDDEDDSHETKIAVFHCPNNTIYDESKVQCVEESKSDKKCNGQLAKKIRVKRFGILSNEPIIVTSQSMACPGSGHFPFEKHDECSAALLKCELTKSGKLRGYVYRCPEEYVYWSISRRCEPLRKMIDCKKTSEAWSRRYDVPIEKDNVGH